MIIKWCFSPNDHINFPQLSSGWYMSRWYSQDQSQELTVICARLDNAERVSYTNRLFSTIKKLWAGNMFPFVFTSLESLLIEPHKRFSLVEHYSITYTEIQPGVSFYNYITEMTATVMKFKWFPRKELTVADNNIMFKRSCIHVSIEHSDTV